LPNLERTWSNRDNGLGWCVGHDWFVPDTLKTYPTFDTLKTYPTFDTLKTYPTF
jgi:hypothetical protein